MQMAVAGIFLAFADTSSMAELMWSDSEALLEGF